MTTARKTLSFLLRGLNDAEIVDVIDYIRWLESEEDTLAEDELALVRVGEEEISRGEYVTLAELRRSWQ